MPLQKEDLIETRGGAHFRAVLPSYLINCLASRSMSWGREYHQPSLAKTLRYRMHAVGECFAHYTLSSLWLVNFFAIRCRGDPAHRPGSLTLFSWTKIGGIDDPDDDRGAGKVGKARERIHGHGPSVIQVLTTKTQGHPGQLMCCENPKRAGRDLGSYSRGSTEPLNDPGFGHNRSHQDTGRDFRESDPNEPKMRWSGKAGRWRPIWFTMTRNTQVHQNGRRF